MPEELALADELGASATVLTTADDLIEVARELTRGGADVAIETAGHETVLACSVVTPLTD